MSVVGEADGAVDYEYWSRLAYWSLPEAVALSEGREPNLSSGEDDAYTKTYDVVKRAVDAGLLTDPILPSDFANWAKRKSLPVPEDLLRLVAEKSPLWVDWQAEAERLRAESERLAEAFEYHKNESARKSNRISDLGGEIDKLRAAAQRAEVGPVGDQNGTKRYNTILKLVGGMAMAVYGFNPDLPRSGVVADIQNDLDLKGINMDADTIRKKLKEAAKLLKTAENREAKPK